MSNTIFSGLAQNIALLLGISILYDYFWAQNENTKNTFQKIIAGILIGMIGIMLMIAHWTFKSGLFFDTRSILLAISGLFFGPIPTIVSMVIVGSFRCIQGGEGVYMGLAVILLSGSVGILWGYYRPDWKKKNTLLELIGVGVTVHLLMIIATLLLPNHIRAETLKSIKLAVLTVYPLTTILLGKLMLRQSKNWENKKALDISEDRWRFALEGAGDGVWDWNPKTDEIYFSKQWKSMLGYSENEIKNSIDDWKKLLHEEDKNSLLIVSFLTKENNTFELEQRLKCKDGSYKWILVTGKLMSFDEDGNPIRCIGTNKDISDRKEKELLLARERFLMDSLMNFAPESIFFKDLESRYIRVNNTFAKSVGYESPQAIIGKTDFDLFTDEFAKQSRLSEKEIIRSGKQQHIEEQGTQIDGTEVWGITNKQPLLDPNGKIIGTFGLRIDITERIKYEQALKESEKYTNSILKAIPDLIFILDSEGKYLEFKTGNIEDLVIPKDEIINKNVTEVLPRDVAKLIKSTIKKSLKEQEELSIDYEVEVKRGVNAFECYIVPFGEDKVISMVRNITRRKQVEEALKSSKEQLKNFAAHLQHVREEERILLAREIHDELGQILVAMKIDVGIFKQKVMKIIQAELAEDISMGFDHIYKNIDTTIKTTRKIMTGLRPEIIELEGVNRAIEIHISEFNQRFNINCSYTCTIPDLNIDYQQSIALFRILQESLNNVAKHSKATKVDVSLDLNANFIIMKIIDNGVGFDTKKKHRNDAYGLLGMQERVHLLNGELTISSDLDKGTTVLIEMPYNKI